MCYIKVFKTRVFLFYIHWCTGFHLRKDRITSAGYSSNLVVTLNFRYIVTENKGEGYFLLEKGRYPGSLQKKEDVKNVNRFYLS